MLRFWIEHFPSNLLDRYQPERKIAEGGFGSVWLARQRVLDRHVALKTLHAELAKTDEQVRRFTDEARVTASISHPGVVRLLDYGVDSGVPWMAFELVEGPSLRGRVASGPQPWRLVAEIGRQVAIALEEAHRCGVVHRDIKPDNILECEPGRYKIADFGIAKWAGASVRTEDGIILGTPAYISPVQIRGIAPDCHSDLYALGISLFELCTGELPFQDASPLLVMERHMGTPAPSVSSRVPAVSPDFDRIVARLLAKRREDRYDSAADVAAAFAIALGESSPAAVPAASRQGLTRPISRAAPPKEILSEERGSEPAAAPAGSGMRRAALGLATTAILIALLVLARTGRKESPREPAASPSAQRPAPIRSSTETPDLELLERDIERFRSRFISAQETLPSDEEIVNDRAQTQCARGLALLGVLTNEFLQLVRRANRYEGPGADRLLRLERQGEAMIGDTGRHLRYSDALALQVGGDSSLKRPSAELASALRKLADELAVRPREPVVSVVGLSLGLRVRELAEPSHMVAMATHRSCLFRAAERLESLAALRGGARSIHALVEQIGLLDRIARWSPKLTLFNDRAPAEKTPMDPDRRRAQESLVLLLDTFMPVARTVAEPVDDLQYALESLFAACASRARDRSLGRSERLRALTTACELDTIPGSLSVRQFHGKHPLMPAIETLRKAAADLGAPLPCLPP